MARKRRFTPFKGDRSLWIIIASLCVISLLVVYSSTSSMAYRNADGDTSYYLLRQVRFIILGFIVIYIIHWIDVRHYIKYSKFLFSLSLILMGCAYLFGMSLNDASRWLPVPLIGITFQPADAIKITLAMVLAVQLGTRQGIINRIPILPSFSRWQWRMYPQKNRDIFYHTTKPIVLPIFLACGVILPSNLSTSLIIFVSSAIVLTVGRVRVKELWRLIILSIVAVVIVIGGMKILGIGRADTWISRLEMYVMNIAGSKHEEDKVVDFQSEQAKIAIASGGFWGKGPGNSTQRSQLPHPYSDFAYAFIIEEYGMLGALLVPVLYLWIFFRARVIIYKSRRPVYGLLVLGLSLTITLSAFIHIFVSAGIVPVTGQALPLISLGGSSVLFTSLAFGMILSMSRENNEEEAAELALARAAHRNALAQMNAPPIENVNPTARLANPISVPKYSRSDDDGGDDGGDFKIMERQELREINNDQPEKIILTLDDDDDDDQ